MFEGLMAEYFTDALMVATFRSIIVPMTASLIAEEKMFCVMSVGTLP